MRGMGFNGTTAAYSPQFQSPAYSPFSAAGAQQAGAATAATAGAVIQTVAAPVIGFSRGLLQGRGMLLGLAIIAVVLYKAQENS